MYATNGTDAGKRWTSGAPLILAGNDGGEPWWAGVRADFYDNSCRRISFQAGEGAWLEAETVHLSNGLVLPLAGDFEIPGYPPDAFPLRKDDQMCLNGEGAVRSVQVWIPY
jgi:hypothetical protein